MDRRSWLWRRRSSDKSPGETESSGSLSSHSERLSDEHGSSNHNTQSPEVASKAAPGEEQVSEDVKALTEKLSAAIMNINAKEELVKQHAKVAEEAVTGWEKAEKEVITLKLQLEAVGKKNSALEDRVSHLDGALKECMRQLRQAREEQDQKIEQAVTKRSREWDSKKSELDRQIIDFQSQLEIAKAEAYFVDSDLRPKLEAAEKDNAALRLELLSLSEELKVKTLERDLSTRMAETASKQRLESRKRVAKLEAECLRLKSFARRASPMNDVKSVTTSTTSADSTTDSQSDCGDNILILENEVHETNNSKMNKFEPTYSDSRASAIVPKLDWFKKEKIPPKKPVIYSSEINLMDDFLEMELLVASPGAKHKSSSPQSGISYDKTDAKENALKVELEGMIARTADLEERTENMEREKIELCLALTECQDCLETSQQQFKVAEAKLLELHAQLRECQDQLITSQGQLKEADTRIAELQTQLASTNESKQILEAELEINAAKREEVESQLRILEAETTSLLAKLDLLEEEVDKERALGADATAKCLKLEDELSKVKHEAQSKLRTQEAETTSQLAKLDFLEEEVDKERALGADATAKCQKLEDDLSKVKHEAESLRTLEAETTSLLAKVDFLEKEVDKERALGADATAKCQKLEDELSKVKHEAETQRAARANPELNILQDKERAVAAEKLADCQKTISSLGRQLKSLASFDDFIVDSAENPQDNSRESSNFFENGRQLGGLHLVNC